MKLYHTGALVIRQPDIRRGRKNADFGQGFYLTPDREFALRWAEDKAVINRYELELSALTVRSFTRNAEWLDYILQNRRANDTLTADVVIGPIANDTIFDTLGIVGSGLLQREDALKLLALGPEYTQVAVKTPRAAAQLRWIGAETVERPEGEERRKEQEAYQRSFGALLLELWGESGEADAENE